MKVEINKRVFNYFHPNLRIAFIRIQNSENSFNLQETGHLLKEMQQLIRLTFHKETVKNHHLISPWSVVQAEFGKAAEHYHTSVERLLQKVLYGRDVTTKTAATNLIRYISLKYIIPISADDITKVRGDLTFGVATGNEKKGMLRRLQENELYYHDDLSVLGAKLDYWKTRRTRVSSSSDDILIHIEALPPITNKTLQLITKELAGLLTSFCNAKVSSFILSKKAQEKKLEKG